MTTTPRLFLITALILLHSSGCASPPSEDPSQPVFRLTQPRLLGASGTLTNAWADFDSDGDPDLFVGFNGEPNRLYRNDDGVLVDVSEEAGVADARPTRTSAWGDYDADGDPDLFLGFAGGEAPVTRLYRNDEGRFVDVTEETGSGVPSGATRQGSWVDYDADGDLDLFLALRDRANMLLENHEGAFRDVAENVGVADPRRTVGALWFDFQEDGDLDLLVANMDGDANGLFRNDGGTFIDVASEAGLDDGGRGLGAEDQGSVRPCVVDYDNDGEFEIFFANYGPNGLFDEGMDGRWRNVAPELGLAVDARYDACSFGDFDLDGRVDLFVNGTVTGGTQYGDHLYRNAPDGFVEVTPNGISALDADHGAQWVDFDGDGDLDLSLAGVTAEGMHHVLRNETPVSPRTRSLLIRVRNRAGSETLAGAEVRVYDSATGTLLGTRLMDTGSGYNTQSSLPVHFGLPSGGPVDVEVTFPGRGSRRVTTEATIDPTGREPGRPVLIFFPDGKRDPSGREDYRRGSRRETGGGHSRMEAGTLPNARGRSAPSASPDEDGSRSGGDPVSIRRRPLQHFDASDILGGDALENLEDVPGSRLPGGSRGVHAHPVHVDDRLRREGQALDAPDHDARAATHLARGSLDGHAGEILGQEVHRRTPSGQNGGVHFGVGPYGHVRARRLGRRPDGQLLQEDRYGGHLQGQARGLSGTHGHGLDGGHVTPQLQGETGLARRDLREHETALAVRASPDSALLELDLHALEGLPGDGRLYLAANGARGLGRGGGVGERPEEMGHQEKQDDTTERGIHGSGAWWSGVRSFM